MAGTASTQSQQDYNLIGTQVHPTYLVKKNMWIQTAKAYAGGVVYKYAEPSYLHRFDVRETEESYEARKLRAVYLNNVQPLSDMIAGFVFAIPPARKDVEQVDYLQKSANQHLSMNEFMKMVCLSSLLYTCGVLVDSPDFNPDEIRTEADRREKGVNPFCMLYSPWQIRNFSVGRDGKLDWLVLDDTHYYNGDPFTRAQVNIQFTLWTRKTVQRFTAKTDLPINLTMYSMLGNHQGLFNYGMNVYNLFEYGAATAGAVLPGSFTLTPGPVVNHPCGEVPFKFANWTNKNRSFFVDSSFEDITLFDQAMYNYMSLLDEVVCGGVFKYLFWPGKMPESVSGGGLTHCSSLSFDPTASIAPFFAGPTLSDIQPFLTVLDFLIAAVKRTLGLETDINKANAQSGVAKEYDFSKLNAFLNMGAGAMEDIEKDIYRLAGLWEGKSVDASVEYRKDIIGKEEERELARMYEAIMLPYGELKRQAVKRIAALNFSDVLTPDEMKTIYDDIDKTEDDAAKAAKERPIVTPEKLAEMAKKGEEMKSGTGDVTPPGEEIKLGEEQ